MSDFMLLCFHTGQGGLGEAVEREREAELLMVLPLPRHLCVPVERTHCTQWRNSYGPGKDNGNLRISHGLPYQGRGIS